MIKVQSGAILLQTAGGKLQFLDLDALHDSLWKCCRNVGIDDPELPGDVINVVSAFSQHQTDMDAAGVDRLIIRVLCDSGMRALAEEFARTRDGDSTPPMSEEQIDADEVLIAGVLKNNPFFLAKPIDQLGKMVAAQLRQLGLKRCTPTLAAELAMHAWQQLQQPSTSGDDAYWLIHRNEMPGFFDGRLLELITCNILQPRSVSHLFPAVVIGADLVQFAGDSNSRLILELQLLPRVGELCTDALAVHQRLSQEVADRLGSAPPQGQIEGRIVFSGLTPLAQECFAGAPKRAAELKKNIDLIAKEHFERAGVAWSFGRD